MIATINIGNLKLRPSDVSYLMYGAKHSNNINLFSVPGILTKSKFPLGILASDN
jgi:hypothetical protein